MKIGLLGSGSVGQALAKGFISEGHEVYLATHEPGGDKGVQLKDVMPQANVCTFAEAAEAGELLVLCVKWAGVEEVINLAGQENLAGKVVIDTSNVIKTDGGTVLYGGGETSAGEQVQAWLPESKVVKAFNTVGASMMYKPQLESTPTMFLAGNDAAAKQQVSDLVQAFGWEPLDAGALTAARDLEHMAMVWINYAMAHGPNHAFKML